MARTEMKGERKRMTKTKQNTSNSSYLGKKLLHKFFPWALQYGAQFSATKNINLYFLTLE